MNPLIRVLIVLVVGAVVVYVAKFNMDRLRLSRQTMERWLKEKGYTLVRAQLCWWPMGPFSWAIARHEPVYRVVARDASGGERRGWVHCLKSSDQAEAAWEKTP